MADFTGVPEERPAPSEPSPASSGGSFIEIWLKAVTQPNEQAYRTIAEDPAAAVGRGALWLAGAGLVAYTISAAGELVQRAPALAGMTETAPVESPAALVALILICVGPVAAIVTTGLSMLYAAILQFVAGALGGAGSFNRLFFSMSAYSAPVTLVTGALNVIPILGPCLSVPISLYALFLNVLAIKAVNRFGWGRAVVTVLIPIVVFTLIGIILFFLLLFPALDSIMQEIPAGF